MFADCFCGCCTESIHSHPKQTPHHNTHGTPNQTATMGGFDDHFEEICQEMLQDEMAQEAAAEAEQELRLHRRPLRLSRTLEARRSLESNKGWNA